jgi:23S rRNA pseudouridine1911/1915/1917 synthase
MEEPIRLTAENDDGRLDVYLAAQLSELSRSRLQKLAEEGRIQVNGRAAKGKQKVQAGDVIEVFLPDPEPLELVPENIPLDIVYEDGDFLVINKPRGMVVHPAAGNATGTLVQALLYHCDDLSGIGGTARPGIVHRIDKDTTGLLVVAKNDFAHQSLSAQIRDKTAGRCYKALVEGIVGEAGRVDAPIARDPKDRKRMAVVQGGREAVTFYRPQELLDRATLLDLKLSTGRTHKIRVHMASIGHPVIGDPVYGYKKQRFALQGQLLHAWQLHLVHPRSGRKMVFEAPLPEDFQRVLEILRRQKQ